MAAEWNEIKADLADRTHDHVGEAAELLESHDLDEAEIETLRRAAVYAEATLAAIKAAIHSLSKSTQ